MKTWTSICIAAFMALGVQASNAQTQSGAPQQEFRTFHLSAAASQAEQNEVLTAIRNTVAPTLKLFLVPGQNALVVRGAPEEVTLVAEILKELDHPRRQYRLTYIFTEADNGKRVGLQRYSMVLSSGQRMTMKEGSRVPLITGSYTNSDKTTEKQVQYLDVGFTFDSTLQEYGSGYQLKSKIEQSSIAEENSGIGSDDPVIRQSILEGTTVLPEGKPLLLGSLDVVGSTRHIDVEATVEPVH